ncbi:hypothetical protein J2W35_004157 [Variovorax boronicumulans]|uniref:hypothetical protein n=1 Tax=Variovorax boronicumulans TaxID=436515 RepID=UPI002785ECCF|nr:hypothetical protein [Variovorax boronicumulans]MDQ0083791.1 hypothetical protein [Variovorax boronicumulans]
MRASRRPQDYARALRGLPVAAGAAGTPNVPAGLLCRAAISLAAGTSVLAAAAHTGLIALTHLGSDAPSKPDAYKAVWQSNGNAVYAYTREIVNAAIDGIGVVSHHAPLSGRGALVSTGQYLVNALGQRAAQEYMHLSQGTDFDIRWPAISAVAEVIDVATVAGASRFGTPDEPVRFLRGHLSERAPETPYRPPTSLEVIDRVSQRGASRHLVAEATQVVPREIGAALRPRLGGAAEIGARWGGTVLQSGTHLRELMWQAEAAVMSTRQVASQSPSNELQRGAADRASFIRQDLDDLV